MAEIFYTDVPVGMSAVELARSLEALTGLRVSGIHLGANWRVALTVSDRPPAQCKTCGKAIHEHGHGKCFSCFLNTTEVN